MPKDTFTRENKAALLDAVNRTVTETAVTDIHTHLYAPPFGELLLSGVDELLTYHYLIAEFFRASDMPCEAFWTLDKTGRADAIWQVLFIEQSPLGEACRGVLTALDALGLDVASRDLAAYRAWYADRTPEGLIDTVLETARLQSVVMTNDPFDDLERPVWEEGYAGDPRFHAALRIDPLLNDWAGSHGKLQAWGYDVDAALSGKARAEVRRFLDDWVRRMKALYLAVSLPPEFMLPEDSARATLIESCVLPVARDHNIPYAMMVGVSRGLNPALRLAGDGVGQGSLAPISYLCATYPKNKFMTTYLARENQHELCVVARKFRNLLPFGCWWFLNNPSLIEEMTRMRIELLGPSMIPQHSDARVLDQVLYKWAHSRRIIARVLCDKYSDLVDTGWTVTRAEITRDTEALLGGNFWRFLELGL